MATSEEDPGEPTELPGEDRSRGILTESDREWLIGERTYANQTGKYKAKNRIKDRLLQGTHDFQYLLHQPDDDRRGVFQVEDDEGAYRYFDLDDQLGDSVTAALAYYLRVADEAEVAADELLEAAFVRGRDDVAEASVGIDLRDDEGEVIQTFHIDDGTIVHQQESPGALDRASPDEASETAEEEPEPEDVGVLEGLYRSLGTAGKQVASTLIEAAFYVYIIAFAWLTYQQYGLGATVATFTAIGVIIWVLSQLGDWVRGFSDEEDATLLDGVRAALGREDTGAPEDASTDGGVDEREPAQEAA